MRLSYNFLLLPNKKLDVNQILLDAGRTADEISQTINTTGISHIYNAYPKLLTEFLFDGLSKLVDSNNNIFTDVEAIIVVSQSYDQRIPSISTRIQSKFGLNSEVFCLDLIDGCSGYIKALSLASMLKSKGVKKVLIIAGDLNSMMTNQAEIGTRILFGE